MDYLDGRLVISKKSLMPDEPDIVTTVASRKLFPGSLIYYPEFKYKEELKVLRSKMGLAAPLRLWMDRHLIHRSRRLPFMRSSNVKDDILTGRVYEINFSDLFAQPEYEKEIRPPYQIMEEYLGIVI